MKKKKMAVHWYTPFLPDEIITNILKRLPVKSLTRFQCVNKHWKNLVKSPSFVADHLHHPSNENHCLLYKRGGGADSLNLVVFDSEMLSFKVQKQPSMSNMSCVEIIGSCNGLICVRCTSYSSLGTSLFLWNPATREVRRVPGVFHDDDYGIFYFGFGFSPILNDYKIVKIYMPHGEIKRVEVYSLSTDSWREIEFGNIKGVQIFLSNASGNGSIFWYVWKLDAERDRIVSFDMVMESFTLMSMPDDVDMDSLVLKVIVHDKKLVLIRYTGMGRYDSEFHFWVMEEEAVDGSGKKWNWTKIDSTSLYLSNLSTNQFKVETFLQSHGVDYVLFYVESLVPILNLHKEDPKF